MQSPSSLWLVLAARSQFLQEVIFELLVCAIARPMLKLIAMNLEAERFLIRGGVWRRDVNAKHGAFFRQSLDLVLSSDDLEREARVLDDDAPDSNAAGAPAP